MQLSDYKSKLAHARQERVMSLIQALSVMPTAIHVPARIIHLYRSKTSPALDKFAEVLIADASLSAKVIELANSAWFAPPKPITRVSDALKRIGLSNLLPLLFGLSLAGIFNKADLDSDERESLWQKSLLKGIIARQWVKSQGVDLQEEAFLCGMLQDVALPAMIAGDRSSSPELTGVLDLPSADRAQRESMLFGVDHAEFGRRVCTNLKLPELYIQATATHHAPEGPTLPEEYKALAGGLQLAAAVPHGASRLDQAGAKQLAQCYFQTVPGAGPKEFVQFIKTAAESGKSLMSALAPPGQSRVGMKTFLQEVSEEITHAMFAAIGTTNQTIETLHSEHVELEQKIHQLSEQIVRADYDPLTHVLNRGGLLNRADKLIALARNFEMNCVVGFLDLDNFKSLNDCHGHETGDEALLAVADALRNVIQNRGMVARVGGDEFVFVLLVPADCTQDRIAIEVEQALSKVTVTAGETPIAIRSSTGFAWLGIPKESQTIRDAMKIADHEMYQAKHAA